MNKKEKIAYIHELATAKERFFYNLLTGDELERMYEVFRRYSDPGAFEIPDDWDIMTPEDLQTIEAIGKSHDERFGQLTPEEIVTISLDQRGGGGWKVQQAAYNIRGRLGLNKQTI